MPMGLEMGQEPAWWVQEMVESRVQGAQQDARGRRWWRMVQGAGQGARNGGEQDAGQGAGDCAERGRVQGLEQGAGFGAVCKVEEVVQSRVHTEDAGCKVQSSQCRVQGGSRGRAGRCGTITVHGNSAGISVRVKLRGCGRVRQCGVLSACLQHSTMPWGRAKGHLGHPWAGLTVLGTRTRSSEQDQGWPCSSVPFTALHGGVLLLALGPGWLLPITPHGLAPCWRR